MTIFLQRSPSGRYVLNGPTSAGEYNDKGAAERRGMHAAGMGERFAHDIAALLRTHGEVIVTIR